MSSLESMLAQLKQSMEEKNPGSSSAIATLERPATESESVSETVTAALREFLNNAKVEYADKSSITPQDQSSNGDGRQALSEFIGSPFESVHTPYQPTPITGIARTHGHGHGGGHGHKPAHGHGSGHGHASASAHPQTTSGPGRMCTCGANSTGSAPSPQQGQSISTHPTTGGSGQSISTHPTTGGSGQPISTHPTTGESSQSISTHPTTGGSGQSISIDQNATPVNLSAPRPTAPPLAWAKHIQSIESALRIGDAHFAESMLTLLLEVHAATSHDLGVKARLNSQRARLLMERGQLAEAEIELQATLRSLYGTAFTKSLGTAYCMLALAQCYVQGNKPEKAEQAQRNACVIAEACLGPDNPETKFFAMPLAK